MTRAVLPPEYVKVDVDWLYGNHEIKEPAKIFYMQLMGLAWGRESTPWLEMSEIEELTGKKHSVIWGYMSTLRTYRRLSWRTSGDGRFMYTFTEANSESSEQLRKFGISSSSSLTTVLIKQTDSIKEKEEPTPKVRSSPKVRSGVPASPLEANQHPDIAVFKQAANVFPGEKQYQKVIESIQLLRQKHGVSDAELVQTIKPYHVSYCSRTTKEGVPYNKHSLVWLEWAINENIPPVRIEKTETAADTTRDDYRRRVADAARSIR